jgi:hypothetical protein
MAAPEIRLIPSLIYTGGPSEQSPQDYINFFSTYANACAWDLPTTKLRLWLHIQGTGHPMEWKTTNNAWLMDAATTWQQIIDRFVSDLNPVMGFNEDITVFTGAYQQASEPLAFYLDRMKRLYKKVAGMLTEAQAVSITLDNVYPAYRPLIETYNLNTFKDAELRFRKAERFYQQSLTYQQPINNNIPQAMAYQQPTNSVPQASLTDTAEIIKTVLAAIGTSNRDLP